MGNPGRRGGGGGGVLASAAQRGPASRAALSPRGAEAAPGRRAGGSQVRTPPPRRWREEGPGRRRPSSITWPQRHKNNRRAGAGASARGTRGPSRSPRPMEDSFLESFGRLSLQHSQPRAPAPPPPRGTAPRRHSFRKHLYLLRGLPGSGKTTLAR
ncbi:hypothetical protein QTO34_017090 [Cnephaeus nilssonii]|uniref:NEDD4-binding protein 2-like 1 n=1 Tax=Cnephaeus nilssonii TaxID=3371016 RepID=A0AA40I0F8_CNENI|nr:hypothetical protein QTO34_017090 [Eptesicus nilssonii]